MAIFNINEWELTNTIKSNYDSILNEYYLCSPQNKPKFITSFNDNLHEGHLNFLGIKMDTRLWNNQEKQFYTPEFESKVLENYNLSPVSSSIIEQFTMIRQWFWHDLGPHAEVTKHYGVNGVNLNSIPDHYRLQYCFIPSQSSYFFLKNKKIKYDKLVCFGFEDGMDLHWVKNFDANRRLVLIIDVWKNQCPPIIFDNSIGEDY